MDAVDPYSIKFINDYDYFEAGETWYTVKDEEFYIDDMFRISQIFKEDTEVEIVSISRESNYGFANIKMDGNELRVGLDELYDMVWE